MALGSQPASGLLEGINTGLGNINKALEFSQDMALRKMQTKGLLAEKGYTTDEDGNVQAMPYKQAENEYSGAQAQAGMGLLPTQTSAAAAQAQHTTQQYTPPVEGAPNPTLAGARGRIGLFGATPEQQTAAFPEGMAPVDVTAAEKDTESALGHYYATKEGAEARARSIIEAKRLEAQQKGAKDAADLDFRNRQLREIRRHNEQNETYQGGVLRNKAIDTEINARKYGQQIEYDPSTGQKHISDLPFEAERNDPNSVKSQQLQGLLVDSWKLQHPTEDPTNFAKRVSAMSANDINKDKDISKLVKTAGSDYGTKRQQMAEESEAFKAGHAFDTDQIIKPSKVNLNSLERAMSIIHNQNKPVLVNDLNTAFQDYINAVTPGGAATEGKINRDRPPSTLAQEWNDIKGRFGQYDDLRKNPTGQKVIQFLEENAKDVTGMLRKQISDRSDELAQNYAHTDYAKVKKVVSDKVNKNHYSPPPARGLIAPTPQESTSPTQTQIGTVKAGRGGIKYRFKGGNVNDKGSWEQVQ